MMRLLTYILSLALMACVLVIAALAADRAPQWQTTRDRVIANHPACAYCGSPAEKVHHIVPFHVDDSKELNTDNLLALCDACHGTTAHLDRHYQSWNPLIAEEIKLHKAMVAARPKTEKEAKAFVKRFRKCFDEANYQNAQ